MKVRLTMEIELPDEMMGGDEEYTDEENLSYVHQLLFDNLTNFAVCKHIIERMEWLCRDASSPEVRDAIIQGHKQWQEILNKAQETMRLEQI